MVWIWKFFSFLVFGNFSYFQEISNSREFHFSISVSRHFHFTSRKEWIRFLFQFSLLEKEWIRFSFHFSLLEKSESNFHFTFHFSKRINQIFISLFTSRKEWNRFSFHFSLLELSISTLAARRKSVTPGVTGHLLICSSVVSSVIISHQ